MTNLDDLNSLLAEAKRSAGIRVRTPGRPTTAPYNPLDPSKTTRKPSYVEPRTMSDREAAQLVADSIEWTNEALVLVEIIQRCDCGSTFHSQAGIFYRQRPTRRRADSPKRMVPITFVPESDDSLPHELEQIDQRLHICSHCLLERGLADAILQLPRADADPQLALFPNLPQRRRAA